MASISVRKLDDEVFLKLKVQADKNGVSMEEEVRQILTRGVSTQVGLGDMALNLFEGMHDFGEEALLIPEREAHEPIEFS